MPIRQPLGGVCLFGANEIVYLNQSVPPHGISLNSCSDDYSRLPLSCKQQNMRITLDGCAVQTLPDIPNDILVISREGYLYILTLETDQANVVRGMQLKQTFGQSSFMPDKNNLQIFQKHQFPAHCLYARQICSLLAPD